MSFDTVVVKTLIRNVIENNPSPAALREFTFVCRKIAVVHLRRRLVGSFIESETRGLAMEDIALDCIADLFSRNESGALVQLQVYFDGFNFDAADEAEAFGHLRRLVFSRVNQSIFRIYNELDPTLGRILRNIKIAIDALQNFTIATRFGQITVTPLFVDPLIGKPEADMTTLVVALRDAGVRRTDTVPVMLSRLSSWLKHQEEYCRILPMMGVAQVLRTIYEAGSFPEEEGLTAEESISEREASTLVAEACCKVKRTMYPRYVGKEKLDERMFGVYFEVISERLERSLARRDGDEISYFDEVVKRAPEVTYEEYRTTHRKVLEYLGRLAEEEAKKALRKEL